MSECLVQGDVESSSSYLAGGHRSEVINPLGEKFLNVAGQTGVQVARGVVAGHHGSGSMSECPGAVRGSHLLLPLLVELPHLLVNDRHVLDDSLHDGPHTAGLHSAQPVSGLH